MGSISEKLKEYFSKDRLKKAFSKKFLPQQIGALLIIVALVLTWQQAVALALITLLAVGVLDIVLYVKDCDTISQWIHDLLPKFIDVGVVVGILLYTWHLFGPVGFLPVCIGVIVGHLFWQE